MPGMTNEYKLKISETKMEYFLRIFDFGNKMKTWRIGREVHSLPFLVGESEFQLHVYPNGIDGESRSHVSVFLQNRSDSKVQVKFEAEVGRREISDTFDMKPNSSFGWPTFYDHFSLGDDDGALDEDDDFMITATVTLKWEEVTTERKDSTESQAEVSDLKSEVVNLRKKVETLASKKEVNDLKKKIETLASKKEVNDLKKKIETMDKNLTAQFKALKISSQKTSLPCPECPICFDEMKPPTRIIQCRSGHLVCQPCRDRPQVTSCPTCKQEFTGRAIGMENYLRTIVG